MEAHRSPAKAGVQWSERGDWVPAFAVTHGSDSASCLCLATDVYVVDDAGDNIDEAPGAGTAGNDWTIEGDTNGDGIADLEILFTTSDAHPIGAADFVP